MSTRDISERNIPLLITGEVMDDRDTTIRQLQDTNRMQVEEIRELRDEIIKLRSDNSRAIAALRKTLTPLHRSLQQLFGEMDAIDGGNTQAASASGSDNSKWDFWKRRYPGRIAEAIDILMLQPMNTKQLSHALKCDPRTLTSKVIYPMNQSGLLNKSGGVFSLKQL
jgi:hypothetical protein